MEANYKEVLENLMHELARINSVIKASAETVSRTAKKGFDKNTIIHHSEMILENSFIFSTHLDMVNYQLNPEFFELEKPDKRNLYGKFYKAILSYSRAAKHKNIDIITIGEAKTLIDSYPVIDSLPILIIDNAVKYTPKGCEIEVEFYETLQDIEVTISNMGPYLKPEEREQIFFRGYRGEEAVKTNTIGQGYGMSFIKHICDIHNAEIIMKFSDDISTIGQLKYSEFKLIITFPKSLYY